MAEFFVATGFLWFIMEITFPGFGRVDVNREIFDRVRHNVEIGNNKKVDHLLELLNS